MITKSAFTGGFWGALGGMANFGIGSLGGDWYTRMALHSISDGTMEALQGGHFEHGLYVGMVSAGGNELISGYANHMTDVGTIATSAVLGGVVSEIGGGKFANGAMTSAFQMMYNHMSHTGFDDGCDDESIYTSAAVPYAIALSAVDGLKSYEIVVFFYLL